MARGVGDSRTGDTGPGSVKGLGAESSTGVRAAKGRYGERGGSAAARVVWAELGHFCGTEWVMFSTSLLRLFSARRQFWREKMTEFDTFVMAVATPPPFFLLPFVTGAVCLLFLFLAPTDLGGDQYAPVGVGPRARESSRH